MTRWSGMALVLALLPATALADRCLELRELVAHAEDEILTTTAAKTFTRADSCTDAYDEHARKSYLCQWQFPYRDAAATTIFETLNEDIRRCLPDLTVLPADTAVNHPDSYLLHRFRHGDLVISASLKDKAALGQSLVFLRIDRE